MKKMPCLFVRDFLPGGGFTITQRVTLGCEWVLSGEGTGSRKWDGTAVLVKGGKVYARYDAKKGKAPPAGAIPCTPEPDAITGHWPHWVEATRPEDKWIAQAHANSAGFISGDPDGTTYEAIGPKINGNPEGMPRHILMRHSDARDAVWFRGEASSRGGGYTRSLEGIRSMLEQWRAEGIVFHHPDGRMCKIRRDDFGFLWPLPQENGLTLTAANPGTPPDTI